MNEVDSPFQDIVAIEGPLGRIKRPHKYDTYEFNKEQLVI